MVIVTDDTALPNRKTIDDKLLKYFQRIMHLSDEEIRAIVETMSIQHFK